MALDLQINWRTTRQLGPLWLMTETGDLGKTALETCKEAGHKEAAGIRNYSCRYKQCAG